MNTIKIDLNKLIKDKISKSSNKSPRDSFSFENKEQDVIQKKEMSNETCPFCGNKIEAGEKICHLCGNDVREIVKDNDDGNFEYITNKRNKFLVVLVIIIIISLLSMYIFYPFYRYTFKNKRILENNTNQIEVYMENYENKDGIDEV